MIVNISSGAEVRRVREGAKDSGGSSAGDGPCIHFSEDHAGGFDQTERGVDGEEFAERAGAESVSIVHAEAIRDPIIFVPRKLSEFVGAVGSGRERFLKLVVSQTVITTNPNAAFGDGNILGSVGGGFANDVRPRS